jgi:hypothetical protein
MGGMNGEQKKRPSAARQALTIACVVVGLAASLGLMHGLGLSGAIPGAIFGAIGGAGGAAIAWLIALCCLKE